MKCIEPRPGLQLDGKYTLVRLLGSGSTGAAWLAESESGPVACKLLHPHLQQNERAVGQLRREADILSRLSHAHIARHIEVCTGDKCFYIVLEYIDGRPLNEVLGEQTRRGLHFSGRTIRALFGQLCAALTYAHAQGVVHRDIKPQNIIVINGPSEPQIKVLDFGHARLVDGSLFDATTVGRTLGSPMYMSPEQVNGRQATVESDVFALATVLFELVTLHRAWVRDEHNRPMPAYSEPPPVAWNNLASIFYRIALAPRPRIQSLRGELAASLDVVIDRALAVEPSSRPSTVDAFRQAVWPGLLEITGASQPVEQPRPPEAARLFEEFGEEPGADILSAHTPQAAPWAHFGENELARAVTHDERAARLEGTEDVKAITASARIADTLQRIPAAIGAGAMTAPPPTRGPKVHVVWPSPSGRRAGTKRAEAFSLSGPQSFSAGISRDSRPIETEPSLHSLGDQHSHMRKADECPWKAVPTRASPTLPQPSRKPDGPSMSKSNVPMPANDSQPGKDRAALEPPSGWLEGRDLVWASVALAICLLGIALGMWLTADSQRLLPVPVDTSKPLEGKAR